jgi:hypothetical protein
VPELTVSAYGQLGLGYGGSILAGACGSGGWGCAIFDLRVGLELQLHATSSKWVQPWLGIGSGYERLSISGSRTTTLPQGYPYYSPMTITQDYSAALAGFEFVNLQGGLDVATWDERVAWGPFAMISLGQYSTTSGEILKINSGDKAWHCWIELGLRLTAMM